MKKNYIIILFLFIGILSSCKKDDGVFTTIDEVIISDIANSYQVINTDLLNIRPVIKKNGQDIDDTLYDFLWVNLGDENLTKLPDNADTIAYTRNLEDGKMGYPSLTYRFLFRMIEKSSGISYSKQFLVNISSEFKKGFLVLTEQDGEPRLDMVVDHNGEYTSVIDVLGKTNSALKLTGQAYFLSRMNDPFSGDKLYIGTSTGTNKIEAESFTYTPSMNVSYEFKTGSFTPDNFKPQYMKEGFEYSTALYNEGDIYISSLFDGVFNVPINNFGEGNVRFNASKWIAPYMTNSYDGNYILYDEDNQKFYNYRAGALGVSELPTGKLFDYHIKKKLIFMGSTIDKGGEVFAVLKNNTDDKYFLARFKAGYTEGVGEQISYDEINLPEFDQATAFAVSDAFGYLFYAVNDRLYSYDSGNKTVKLMKTYNGRNITYLNVDKPAMAYWPESDFEGKLFVGTHGSQANSGEIEVFETQPIQGDLVLLHNFQGLGKIKDILRLY